MLFSERSRIKEAKQVEADETGKQTSRWKEQSLQKYSKYNCTWSWSEVLEGIFCVEATLNGMATEGDVLLEIKGVGFRV